jgi:hypothetical protein
MGLHENQFSVLRARIHHPLPARAVAGPGHMERAGQVGTTQEVFRRSLNEFVTDFPDHLNISHSGSETGGAPLQRNHLEFRHMNKIEQTYTTIALDKSYNIFQGVSP